MVRRRLTRPCFIWQAITACQPRAVLVLGLVLVQAGWPGLAWPQPGKGHHHHIALCEHGCLGRNRLDFRLQRWLFRIRFTRTASDEPYGLGLP